MKKIIGKKFYLDVIVNTHQCLEILLLEYLNGKLYQEVLIENPKTEEDFLKSQSFAIPLTDNPVITQLYYLFYKDGERAKKDITTI